MCSPDCPGGETLWLSLVFTNTLGMEDSSVPSSQRSTPTQTLGDYSRGEEMRNPAEEPEGMQSGEVHSSAPVVWAAAGTRTPPAAGTASCGPLSPLDVPLPHSIIKQRWYKKAALILQG